MHFAKSGRCGSAVLKEWGSTLRKECESVSSGVLIVTVGVENHLIIHIYDLFSN